MTANQITAAQSIAKQLKNLAEIADREALILPNGSEIGNMLNVIALDLVDTYPKQGPE